MFVFVSRNYGPCDCFWSFVVVTSGTCVLASAPRKFRSRVMCGVSDSDILLFKIDNYARLSCAR